MTAQVWLTWSVGVACVWPTMPAICGHGTVGELAKRLMALVRLAQRFVALEVWQDDGVVIISNSKHEVRRGGVFRKVYVRWSSSICRGERVTNIFVGFGEC